VGAAVAQEVRAVVCQQEGCWSVYGWVNVRQYCKALWMKVLYLPFTIYIQDGVTNPRQTTATNHRIDRQDKRAANRRIETTVRLTNHIIDQRQEGRDTV